MHPPTADGADIWTRDGVCHKSSSFTEVNQSQNIVLCSGDHLNATFILFHEQTKKMRKGFPEKAGYRSVGILPNRAAFVKLPE